MLYVSSDKTKEDFWNYSRGTPFGCVPYCKKAKACLVSKFQIRSIPTLVVLGPRPSNGDDRPVINSNARQMLLRPDYIERFPYRPRPYGDLNKTSENINLYKCIVIFHEMGDDDDQENVRMSIKSAADAYPGHDDVRFFWAFADSGLSKAVRDALNVPPRLGEPTMAMLDVPDHGSYYVSSCSDISEQSILNFIRSPGERMKM